MKRAWEAVPGYEGLYEVSNIGEVRRLMIRNKVCFKPHKTPRFLKQFVRRKGYLDVSLSKNGKFKQFGVHQVVLMAFVGPKPKGYHGAHLDGDHLNNCVDNLAWVTPRENIYHKKLHGTEPVGSQCWNAKLTELDVVEIRCFHKAGITQTELAERFKVSRRLIRDVVSKKRWNHI